MHTANAKRRTGVPSVASASEARGEQSGPPGPPGRRCPAAQEAGSGERSPAGEFTPPLTGRTVRELTEIVGGTLLRGDPARVVSRVMPTDEAVEDAVTFVSKPKYLHKLAHTRAAAVMLAPEMFGRSEVIIPERVAVIGVERPYVAYARAAQALAAKIPAPLGIHTSSVIDETASIGKDVSIGPFVYVGPSARIEDGVVLYAGVHVEAEARVGAGSVLYNHVVVRHRCVIGARCILHAGVVIGSDGFGFAQEDSEDEGGPPQHHVKIPQLGIVEIGHDVEIGANSCVDRAALGTTRIGAGTKIDNLVQIGHNVEIGEGCILVAQSGVGGSSRLGKGVVLAGQAGVSGHLEVGDHVTVLGQAGVIQDVPAGQRVMGTPSLPVAEHFRNHVRLSKLDALFNRVRKLERMLDACDGGSPSEPAEIGCGVREE